MQPHIEALKERAHIQEIGQAAGELAKVFEGENQEEKRKAYAGLAEACEVLTATMQHIVGGDPENPKGTVAADAGEDKVGEGQQTAEEGEQKVGQPAGDQGADTGEGGQAAGGEGGQSAGANQQT